MLFTIPFFILTNFALYDSGPYHIETSPLICTANQWTGFYMIGTSVMRKSNYKDIRSVHLVLKYASVTSGVDNAKSDLFSNAGPFNKSG